MVKEVQSFLELVSDFSKKEKDKEDLRNQVEAKTEKLLKVEEEEKQMEVVMEALYGNVEPEAETKRLKEEIEISKKSLDAVNKDIDIIRTNLLRRMRNLPIPVNLTSAKREETGMAFPFLEGADFGEQGISVMKSLLRQEPALAFIDVTFLPRGILIKDVSETKKAFSKLLEGIRAFRMRVDDLLKSYEQIDEIVERVRKSSLYSAILITLFKKGRLTNEAIGKLLQIDKRQVYDACYNLTRSNWSPNPVKCNPSGEWELTLPGEILVNRLSQKYGETAGQKNGDSLNQ